MNVVNTRIVSLWQCKTLTVIARVLCLSLAVPLSASEWWDVWGVWGVDGGWPVPMSDMYEGVSRWLPARDRIPAGGRSAGDEGDGTYDHWLELLLLRECIIKHTPHTVTNSPDTLSETLPCSPSGDAQIKPSCIHYFQKISRINCIMCI